MANDVDGYVKVKLDVDTSEEKKLQRSLEDIQDDAENAKRKLEALKQAGVDDTAESYREASAELKKLNDELDEYIKKNKEAAGAKEVKSTKASETGNFDSVSDQVEDYETRLKMLRNKGYGPGDEHFDELYIAWKNAIDAEKEYLSGLEKLTDKSIADEVRKREEENKKLSEQAAEYERINKIRAEAEVRDKNLVELLRKQETIMARMTELKKAGVGEGYKEYDNLKKQLGEIESSIKRCRDGFKKVGESGKKCFNSLNSGVKKSSGLFGAMASRMKGLALSLLIFNWISKGFNAMVSAMKAGFKNLVQYSEEYNASMSGLKSGLAELKNNAAAAFAPIANTIIPYLTMLVSELNTATESVSRFMAYISGKDTYTRAKKQIIDYKKTLEGASGSLAKFDSLNVLGQNEGAGGESTGSGAFEEVAIEDGYGEKLDGIKSKFEPIIEAATRFRDALMPLGETAGAGLLWLYENVFVPFGDWALNSVLPSFIDIFSEAISVLNQMIEDFEPLGTWLWENFLQPLSDFTGDLIVTILNGIGDALQWISENDTALTVLESLIIAIGIVTGVLAAYNAVAMLASVVTGALGAVIGFITSPIGIAIAAITAIVAAGVLLYENWDVIKKKASEIWTKIKETVVGFIDKIVSGIKSALTKILDTWTNIFSKIKNFATNVFNSIWSAIKNVINSILGGIEGMANGVVSGVNLVIRALNRLSFTVPDWVPGLGGSEFGFNITELKEVNIPRLKDGDVIPGGKPFLALLGDQKFGQTNIETPLPVMLAAFKQALAESGGTGGDITLNVNLEGKQIYNTVFKQNELRKNAGLPAFE